MNKNVLKAYAYNMFKMLRLRRRRKVEILKLKDDRRKKIYRSVKLSKEQEDMIDDVYVKNYGSIPYVWHRLYTAYTGRFDPFYFPELIYIPEFEEFENLNKSYVRCFEDKNVISLIAKAMGVCSPDVICSASKGLLRDGRNQLLSYYDAVKMLGNVGKCFIKPSVDSGSGKGCFIADFRGGKILFR